ncbi:MAG: hypothetical protein KBS75_08155 [Bacteroidales bacterium]|nr:hypothetical protein [Candidatus Equimonas faecalis]
MDYRIDISKFYLIDKRRLALVMLGAGMLIAYLGSLHPWFMWPLGELYVVPAAAFLTVSYLLSNSLRHSFYCREGAGRAVILAILCTTFLMVVNQANIKALMQLPFVWMIFFCMLRIENEVLQRLATVIAKIMGIILGVSFFTYILYLFGFPFPSRPAVFGDQLYSYDNYYFFMVDDHVLITILPRFSSIFLEPGHVGTATTLLLMTQLGRWKKWYNIILIVITVVTFSLAAYANLIALIFLNTWIQRKHILGKVIAAIVFLATVVGISMNYNDGNNIINQLILLRLEVDDTTGDIAGNNRVTANFEEEFNSYMASSDILFGRDMSKVGDDTGNSGYRVFLYENGLVCTFLVLLFYIFALSGYKDWRALTCSIILSFLIFIVRGYPLWYSNILPILAAAYTTRFLHQEPTTTPQ